MTTLIFAMIAIFVSIVAASTAWAIVAYKTAPLFLEAVIKRWTAKDTADQRFEAQEKAKAELEKRLVKLEEDRTNELLSLKGRSR